MSKPVNSEFAQWFSKQHAKRKDKAFAKLSDQALRDMIAAGRGAERELARREMWDAQRNSALHAWKASRTK